jgi:chromosomal replication initiation ATPase DnaA
MAASPRQLPLPFNQAPRYDPRDFVPAACNQAALTWIGRTTDWPDRRLALWGNEGHGKTHLLHIWAERTGAILLAGAALRTPESLPASGAAALDDADSIVPEPLLLHLLNTARDRGLTLLLAGRTPPARWPVALADLSSRLRAITAIEVGAPDDDLLRALLIHLFADRQMDVGPAVREWLLRRLPRVPAVLRRCVLLLDQESLARGRPVTRAFAAEVLDGILSDPDGACDADAHRSGNHEDSITAGISASQTSGLL